MESQKSGAGRRVSLRKFRGVFEAEKPAKFVLAGVGVGLRTSSADKGLSRA